MADCSPTGSISDWDTKSTTLPLIILVNLHRRVSTLIDDQLGPRSPWAGNQTPSNKLSQETGLSEFIICPL